MSCFATPASASSIRTQIRCLESLALNESTDFASKNFILFAKVLRSLLAPRWTLHQEGFAFVGSQTRGTLSKTKTTVKVALFCNKKLLEPSKNRTGINDIVWLKDLHDAIKRTLSSFFKKLQEFKPCLRF